MKDLKNINTPLLNNDLEQRIHKSRNLHIVLISHSDMGHMMPLYHVAAALKERGHQITIVSMDNEKGKDVCSKLFD